MKEQFKLKGIWELKTVDVATGKILQSEIKENTIVNTGLERVAKLLNGESSTYFRAIGVGTGTTGALATNTTLETEVTRELASLSYEASYKAKFEYTFSFGGDYAITEAGLFDSDTVSASVMLNRTTFSAKNVSTTVQLIVTATITVS